MTKKARGTNRDSFDSRDLIYRPALVELRPQLLPDWEGIHILHQGEEGACTGFGLAATINYLLFLQGKSDEHVSARMLFELAKRYDQWPGTRHNWSSARGAMKGWYKHGACAESAWPNHPADDRELSLARQDNALQRPLGAYYRILPTRSDVHAALNEVGVLFASAATHAGWDEPDANGRIELRHDDDPLGHAFAIIGYTDDGFIVQNSWGTDWGGVKLGGKRRAGMAIWRYADFDKNVWDVWAARLALPVESLQALRSRYVYGESGTRKTESGPPASDVNRHLVHIDDGRFDADDEYASTRETVCELIETKVEAAARREQRRFLMYAHGGLNPAAGAAQRVRCWRDVFDDNQVEHLHWLWDTGFCAEMKDVLLSKLNLALQRTGVSRESTDKFLEKFSRPIGKALWRNMKDDAARAWQESGAGSETLALFAKAAGALRDWHLTLVGHSAGAIWLAHALQRWHEMQPDFFVDDLMLLSPACTVAQFKQHLFPHLRDGRVGKLTLMQLSDEAERDDSVAKVYGKSLLYYVSNACEDREGNTPLLGLRRFNAQWSTEAQELSDAGRLELVIAGVDETRSKARSHDGFDNDVTTMNTVLSIALGGATPQRPFTDADLRF